MSNQADVNESLESVSQIKQKLKKKRKRSRLRPNIASSLNQLNAPMALISLPDDLTSKLNFISNDAAASNRLFTTVLTTKQSTLRLNSGERFIESGVPVTVEVCTAYMCAMLLSIYRSYFACTNKCAERNTIFSLKFKLN